MKNVVTRDLELPYPLTVSWIVAPDFNARFLQNLPVGCCCPSAFPVQMKKEKAHVWLSAQTNHHVFLKPTPSTSWPQLIRAFRDQIRLSGSYKKRQHCEDKHGSD